jgi:hypothetical protein
MQVFPKTLIAHFNACFESVMFGRERDDKIRFSVLVV